MTQPQAIIFDLDDTLIDDSTSVEPSWRLVCLEVSQQVADIQPDTLYAAVTRVREAFWADPEQAQVGRRDIIAANNHIAYSALISLGYDLPGCARFISERYRDVHTKTADIYPDVRASLDRLLSAGVKLALITNGHIASQRAKIEHFDLIDYFERIEIGNEFSTDDSRSTYFQAVIPELMATLNTTWVVSHNLDRDIRSAQEAGLSGIWIDRSRAGLPADTAVMPDRIIHSLTELLTTD